MCPSRMHLLRISLWASYCVYVCDLARAYLSPEIIIFDSACKLGSETGGNARMAAVTRVSLAVKLHEITCSTWWINRAAVYFDIGVVKRSSMF